MIEREHSRLEQILAKHGHRWQIEREGLVWTATEHPSPTALHVDIIALTGVFYRAHDDP